ncbi:MAG TPA: amino acid ABC transporter substrate-binding protein [Alphaproteobacteria bacterium]|nr:amino acid ABC transporter substrate-binding protein [Alphaproteobacteria bacterium]
MKRFTKFAALAAVALAVAGSHAARAQQSTLDAVKAKGFVQCGVNTGLAGFAAPDAQGVWKGIDVDVCRAVAAAVLGDASKVKYTGLTAQQRFTAIQSGEVDILARNTTWTSSRDSSLGLDFTTVDYYDGQGFMVKKASGVKSAKELDGATVCVQSGTTTELNLADYFRANNLKLTPVVFEKLDDAVGAYLSGRCDAYTTDRSGLASTRFSQGAQAGDHVILPEVISKEPLAPAVRQGDSKWADIVRWSQFAMVNAEEFGITSANVDSMMNSPNPDIQRFLGKNGEMGQQLGVDNKWAYNIIKQVGNYGESYDRNIKPLGLDRGINALWTKGGIMYAPPVR